MSQRLQTYFFENILPRWLSDYSNSLQIPRLEKIVLNRGLASTGGEQIFESSLQEFQIITGQKALIQYSKKSIAGFHLRKKCLLEFLLL